ncbi:hypothetical protein HDU97_009715 [Phlyctochytrium planicorne]|nr:hypothetical protein HDU97_009715 [Phlyctochytrium planicorne]
MNFDATLQRIPNNNTSYVDNTPPQQSQNLSLAQRLDTVLMVWASICQVPKDNWAKFALFWSLGQFIIVTAFQAIVLSKHVSEFNDIKDIQATAVKGSKSFDYIQTLLDQSRAITVYEGLFLAAQLFQLYLAFDAIISSSKIQLLSQTLFNLSIVGDSVLQFIQSKNLNNFPDSTESDRQLFLNANYVNHRGNVVELIVILLSVLFFAVWCFLSSRLYNIFGWSIFKELGADVGVRQRLKVYHIYVMLLKLDIFFFLGFILQYSILVYWANDNRSANFYAYTFGGPVLAVILLFIAYFSVVRESNVMMTINLVCLSGAVGFLISRMVDIWTTTDNKKYASSKTSLSVFTLLTLALSICTFVVAILNFRNFGKGLMTALSRTKNGSRGQLEMDNMGGFKESRY